MTKLDQFREEAEIALGRIQEMLVPGTMLTLVIRNPNMDDADVLLTDDDDLEAVIASIRHNQEMAEQEGR